MNKLFGNNRRKRIISFFLLIAFISEIVTPTASLALTGGPSQPEVQAFTPVNTSEMVDLTSGDFKYNIPLMDVGGYPLNIAYNSGISMDQEASWVGLGWNLNVGAINRNMRGLPDDFNGEAIEKEFNMKDNNTFGANVGVGVELFGYKKAAKTSSSQNSGVKLNVGLGLTYNNYTGIGMEYSANIGISSGESGKGRMNASLGIKASNSGGLTVSPNVSFSAKTDSHQKGDETTTGSAGIGIGMSMNSRSGLKDLSISASYNRTTEKNTLYLKPDPGSFMGIGIGVMSSSQSGGVSSAGVINFGASTFVPRIQNNMVNNSVALSFKFGTTVFGFDGDITLGGYFSNQSLMSKSSSVPAYGYMFSHNGQQSDDVLMDFNREKDQAFSRYTKNLPITNQTYDVFSVTGQGMGGAFRPFRSDVGYMFDNSATTTSDSYSGGVEFAAAQTAHLGVNISVVDVHTTTGKWNDDNEAKDRLSFKGSVPNRPDYEPFYFKEVGEKSTDDVQSALYDYMGKDEAKRIKIVGLINHKADDVLETTGAGNSSETSLTSGGNLISERQKRNQVLSTLSFDEAKLYGLDKKIYNRSYNTLGMNISSSAKGHHIAEVTALRTDGTRYIYGLPAYNTKQEEVTFNASSKTTSSNNPSQNGFYDVNTGYVTYNTGDRSTSNGKGIDRYYNNVKTPAYAHSYLLTAVVSPDYVDLGNDGPTDDDFGNYTKFKYVKQATTDYKWRMPFDDLKANFNEVGKSIENDDQGNFVYGEKELWFTKEIETKNYIAIFELADRDDALGVASIDGDQGSGKTMYIKSISLYSKPEYNADLSVNKVNAVPIKVVHFEYDYSLCQGIPNNTKINPTPSGITNQGGKLTLKQIYFTYGKSDKAKFSPYKFTYGQELAGNANLKSNFNYHPKAYDRWGNYMPLNNKVASYSYDYNDPSSIPDTKYRYDSELNNSEFPYVDQYSKEDADFRASAWNLTSIDLPSGGIIKINYETDDYAFVQNKPAMQMLKILDIRNQASLVGSGLSTAVTANLFYPYLSNSASNPDNDNNLYLHFELTESNTTTPAQIRERYLKDINSNGKYLYFRVLVNLSKLGGYTTNAGDHFEYVSGYAELDGASPICGLSGINSARGLPIAYVKLKAVKTDDNKSTFINPIAKAALSFGRLHYNNIVWDASFSPPADAIGAVKQLASEASSGFGKQIMQSFAGPNNSLASKDYGNQVVLGKSWIRLYNPNGRKLGGGSRVKSLTINDNWHDQTSNTPNQGQDDSEYGQEFIYETEFDGKTISSGVASYEPMLGGDENPFRQPVFMGPNKWTMTTPDERFFMEEPFGETFFPSASIAYSKVKVKNKIPAGINNLKAHGTGYVIHEFYTAKDYPTITKHTSISPKQWKPALGGLLKVLARDYVSASQGYVIKLNDMHGKPKAQAVYPEGTTTPISKVEYFYKTKGGYVNYGLKDIYSDASCVANELDNTCVVIDQNGTIRTTTIGMDFDAVADFRQSETTTIMGGAQINLSMFLVGVFPGLVPTIWPDFSYEKTRFRSAVITKVISNYGILEKTTAHDLGSKVTTSNLAYDSQTGDVLVTKTKNNFEDDIYSVKYPAFWGYDLMGPAYKNIGLVETLSYSSPGTWTVQNSDFYNIGDELGINGNIGWVCSKSVNTISIIDKNGNLFAGTGSIKVKVLRSGKRNLLGAQMASLTSLVNPIDYDNNDNNGLNPYLDIKTTSSPAVNYEVLNTSAIEYTDQWQTFKGYEISDPGGCECSITDRGIGAFNSLSNQISTNSLPASINSNATNTQTFTVVFNEATCVFNGILNDTLDWKDIHFTNSTPPAYSVVRPGEACSANIVVCAPYTYSTAPTNTVASRGFFLNEGPGVICFTITPANESCGPFVNCSTTEPFYQKCGVDVGDKVNPFVYGIKGNWRPKTTWSYLEERVQTPSSGNNNLDIRKDGRIKEYQPFYAKPASGTKWDRNTNYLNYWTFTSQITKHTPNGVEVENQDALIRYSSALYGYNESLPIAVASNAQLQEIAYDGFEDYNFSSGNCNSFTKDHHFDFYKHKQYVFPYFAHTGQYSIVVPAQKSLTTSKKITSAPCTTAFSPLCSYTLTCNDFIYPFSPISNAVSSKKYVLSYWVKEFRASTPVFTPVLKYQNSVINVSLSGGSGSIIPVSTNSSDIIDGWQRIEYIFSIPALASGNINVTLTNTSPTSSGVLSFFDDIRIHPFNSNMKSFVYNPVTLKYTAELDANNFATFYEYDEEGSLVRVKKETEKGIMTIQETKNHTKR